MAVQAQYPSSMPLSKSHSDVIGEAPAPPSISAAYHCSGDIVSSTVDVKNNIVNRELMWTKRCREEEDDDGKRKKKKREEDMPILLRKEMRHSSPLHPQWQSDAGLALSGDPVPRPRLPFPVHQTNAANVLPFSIKVNEDALAARLMHIPTCTRGRSLLPSTMNNIASHEGSEDLSNLLTNEVQVLYLQQTNELDQLIRLQVELLKIAVEERHQCYTTALPALMEDIMITRLNEKEAELERATGRNKELEESFQQLNVESQVWQNIARNNEAMALNLMITLEQLAAQCKGQQEGSGESEVDDTAACVHGGINTAGMGGDIIKDRSCRVCKMNPVCVLLLPCRHVCLCKRCDPHFVQCPVCGSIKISSLEVYTE